MTALKISIILDTFRLQISDCFWSQFRFLMTLLANGRNMLDRRDISPHSLKWRVHLMNQANLDSGFTARIGIKFLIGLWNQKRKWGELPFHRHSGSPISLGARQRSRFARYLAADSPRTIPTSPVPPHPVKAEPYLHLCMQHVIIIFFERRKNSCPIGASIHHNEGPWLDLKKKSPKYSGFSALIVSLWRHWKDLSIRERKAFAVSRFPPPFSLGTHPAVGHVKTMESSIWIVISFRCWKKLLLSQLRLDIGHS